MSDVYISITVHTELHKAEGCLNENALRQLKPILTCFVLQEKSNDLQLQYNIFCISRLLGLECSSTFHRIVVRVRPAQPPISPVKSGASAFDISFAVCTLVSNGAAKAVKSCFLQLLLPEWNGFTGVKALGSVSGSARTMKVAVSVAHARNEQVDLFHDRKEVFYDRDTTRRQLDTHWSSSSQLCLMRRTLGAVTD